MGLTELRTAFAEHSSQPLTEIGLLHAAMPLQIGGSIATNASPTSATVHPLRQIAEAIVQAGPEAGQTELSLSPEELGKVQFHIRNVDGHLTVAISAERAEILQLLRRNADLLAAELAQSGMPDATLDFSGKGGQTPDRNTRGENGVISRDADAGDSPQTRVEAAQTRTPAQVGNGRLDIRL